jgi:CrcB protein
MTWFLVAVAGAAGAAARYGVGLAVGVRTFPFATFGINVAGSFLLGLLLTVGAAGRLSAQNTTALAVGFLGAFTTYSTFSWETFTLGRTDRLGLATLYVAVSLAAGVLAAAAGYRLGRGWFG